MSVIIRTDNPYAKGKVINFKDGRRILVREKVVYKESPNDKYHLVTDTDTISNLAHNYYGNSKEWWIIADANNLATPWELPIGTNIIIPDKDIL